MSVADIYRKDIKALQAKEKDLACYLAAVKKRLLTIDEMKACHLHINGLRAERDALAAKLQETREKIRVREELLK